MSCEESIPKELHQKNRTEKEFTKNEKGYIRIPPDYFNNETGDPEPFAFSTTKQSFNREKFSTSPKDVLWKENANNFEDHHHDYGIVKFNTTEIQKERFLHEELKIKYQPIPKHTPLKCMYPHSEIFWNKRKAKDDQLIESDLHKVKKKVKWKIRDCYVEFCDVVCPPS